MDNKTKLIELLENFRIDFNCIKDFLVQDKSLITIPLINGRYILHYACWYNAPYEFIKFLIEECLKQECKSVLTKQDNIGWNPLHYACKHNTSDSVIRDLVAYGPIAVHTRNDCGDYPLHLACQYQFDEGIIEILVKENKDAVSYRSGILGYYALHIACQYRKPKSVIELLVEAYPQALQCCDVYGWNALHLACGTNAMVETIKYLVKKFPGAIHQTNVDGNTPLYYAENPFRGQPPNRYTIEFLRKYKANTDDDDDTKPSGNNKNNKKYAEEDLLEAINHLKYEVGEMKKVVEDVKTDTKTIIKNQLKHERILTLLDGKFLNPLPRLFIILPADPSKRKNANELAELIGRPWNPNTFYRRIRRLYKKSASWIRDKVVEKYHLHFLCAKSYQIINPPLKIDITKGWVDKVAPIFAVSLFLVSMALKLTTNINIDLSDVAKNIMNLTADILDKIVADVCSGYEKRTKFELKKRLDEMERDNHILCGNAYDVLSDLANQQPEWKANLVHVKSNKGVGTLWIEKTLAEKENYEILDGTEYVLHE